MDDWQDMVVGDRMAVDNEFEPRIEESRFSRQEWGLIMTATEFEIENPEDEAAAIVANTEELRGMMPEIEKVADMGPMGATPDDGGSGGGLLDSVFDALGLGGNGADDGDSVDEDKLQEAERLVGEYADALQAHLESEGRWDEVRAAAAES